MSEGSSTMEKIAKEQGIILGKVQDIDKRMDRFDERLDKKFNKIFDKLDALQLTWHDEVYGEKGLRDRIGDNSRRIDRIYWTVGIIGGAISLVISIVMKLFWR